MQSGKVKCVDTSCSFYVWFKKNKLNWVIYAAKIRSARSFLYHFIKILQMILMQLNASKSSIAARLL